VKHLPKHLRPRWRYLGVELRTPPATEVGRRAFQRDLWYAAQNLLGDPGSADADLSVLRFEHRTRGTESDDGQEGRGTAIIRVRHGEVEPARAALACVSTVDGTPVGLRVRGVSGTVRACAEKHCPRLVE
jgi:ribonuclease P/MRP protein subunit POP5